jgi:hypothetical protein
LAVAFWAVTMTWAASTAWTAPSCVPAWFCVIAWVAVSKAAALAAATVSFTCVFFWIRPAVTTLRLTGRNWAASAVAIAF